MSELWIAAAGVLMLVVSCHGGVVGSVVAPTLVTSMDSKREAKDPSKKSTSSFDPLWYGSLRRELVTQTKIASEQEFELMNYLFHEQGYNPLVRPVANISEALRVDLGLCMIKLIHIDERRQVMKSNVWLPMVWRDYQLTWDPAKYGGLKVIRVPHNEIWKPDIVLFNNADGNYEVVWQPNLLVHHDGSILWMPPAVYESSCAIDVEYFPFDEQECEMKFGSWAFDASRISLGFYSSLDFVDLSDYWRSGTWDLVDVPARIVNTYSGGVNNTYIVYTIKLRRKTLFYTVNLIVPCVMLSLLSIFVFYLPSDAGEKVTLAISIVVALVVFLILVSKILPPTSITIPLISRYLMFTFVSDVFAVFVTVLVVNWNYRSPRTHTMPRWVKFLFLQFLPRLLFLNRLQYPHPEMEEVEEKEKEEENKRGPYFAANQFSSDNEDAFVQNFPEGASLDISYFATTDSVEGSLSNSSVAIGNGGNFYENLQTQCLTASESQMSDFSLESDPPSVGKKVVLLKGQVKILKLQQSPHRIGARSLRKSSRTNTITAETRKQETFSLLEGLKAVEYISDRLEEKRKDRIHSHLPESRAWITIAGGLLKEDKGFKADLYKPDLNELA
ncbi:Acetylcholine receptor subunit beta-like 1 [Taenia crassiceps]|uniref:Acetylcholine receptor subunit beta-like 1 n=1 Tax=Taenia crassiceps TaxID=6207 RepID=A0ABR4QK37_9CEST